MTTLTSLASRDWDVIIIGGGITGAGILREAARLDLKALLVERSDFASGTSSHSSKLIHGGLRYFLQGQLRMMRESLKAREHLIRAGSPLVKPLGYLHAIYKDDKITPFIFEAGIRTYAMLHGHWKVHQRLKLSELGAIIPGMREQDLRAVFAFDESQTDDARLVLRVLREAVNRGAVALNYTNVAGLWRDENGQVIGILATDSENRQPVALRGRAVVNATGAWADLIRRHIDMPSHLRPMRGSHLVIPGWRLRLARVASFFHPANGRPIYCVPWKGVVLIGTTDVDQEPLMAEERPYTSSEEVEFLLSGLQSRFPALNLNIHDVQAVFAGVRPVVDVRTADPTKASREHVILYESGLLTVVGGKMTTFHTMALDAFEKLRQHIPSFPKRKGETFALDPLPDLPLDFPIEPDLAMDWLSHYGEASLDFLCASTEQERLPIRGGYGASLADLRWSMRHESVHHLDDLLLRRTRFGLTAPDGGPALLSQVRSLVQEELNWTDSQWHEESTRYLARWKKTYGVPSLT
jgi:glycerol-3-phosphate dehydrogenase